MKTPRILILIPNLGPGGAQAVFHQQIKHLSDRHQIIGCVFNWDGSFQVDRTANIVSLDVPAGKNWILKLYCFHKRIVKLRKLKKEYNIAVTISHLEGADYVNLFSKVSDKTICWIHGTKRFDGSMKGFLGLVRRYLLIPLIYRRADKLVSVSRAIQYELDKYYHLGKSKLLTLYNTFDLEKIKVLKEAPLDKGHASLFVAPVLITHCRLAEQKNIVGLLSVFSLCKKQRPDMRLLILGDGELRSHLLKKCDFLGLAAYSPWSESRDDANYDVYFLGYRSNPYPYLGKSTLYIQSSNWEGFPLSLCEAMACGLPVVAADCPTGPREILNSSVLTGSLRTTIQHAEFGCLFPLIDSNDASSLALWTNGILELLENDKMLRHYSITGKSRVSDFDITKNLRLTEDLINDLTTR